MMKICFLFTLLCVLTAAQDENNEPEMCPKECLCRMEGLSFFADCSNAQLSTLPDFHYKNIQWLDLSYNKFVLFPTEVNRIEDLEYLDLSYNQIPALPEYALHGMIKLKSLNLAHNQIRNWVDLEPKVSLLPATQLKTLNLAGNMLTSLSSSSFDDNLQLVSASLEELNLSDNRILKITDDYLLQGLPDILSLDLSKNPIQTMVDIESETLTSLDLSSCNLGILEHSVFSKLANLETINLSRNNRLALVRPRTEEYVSSESLRFINLSYCNMESIDLLGFGNLQTADLSYNMIKKVSKKSFSMNPLLEDVDLSMNSLAFIEMGTFRQLKHLKALDLSYNVLSNLERDMFKDNSVLTTINLSQNYLNKLPRLNAPAVMQMNLSHCEIMSSDRDPLKGLPQLVQLDLGFNLLPEFPAILNSDTLQDLNLQNNRLVSIRNTSFNNLPDLTRLNLAGNRLTTPLKRESFTYNRFLQEIWLGDNPWICDCHNRQMHDFYLYLVEPPKKIMDLTGMKCISPESVFGRSWEGACLDLWYPPDKRMKAVGQFWITVLIIIMVLSCGYCFYASIKKGIDERRRRQQEEELEENVAEAVEVARQNRLRMQQEAQLNAPDPRETHPPCYEEAIRMPKPIFSSLDELSTRRNKRRKSKGDDFQARAHRFRSEEVLSRNVPRLHPFEMEALERTHEPMTPANAAEMEEVLMFNSRTTSPYTRRRGKNRAGSVGSIRSRRSRESFDHIQEELPSTSTSGTKDKDSFEKISTEKSSFEQIAVSKGSGLNMNEGAGKYLEEEIQLLDKEMQQRKRRGSVSSSSASELDFIDDGQVTADVHVTK